MSEGAAMDHDGWENIAWGGLGGLVRWFREPAGATWRDRIINLLSSLIGGICVGKVVSILIRAAFPNVGEEMITACWIVSGFGSGIFIQLANHILGDAAAIARSWCSGFVSAWFDRLKKPTNGTGTPDQRPSPVVGERGVQLDAVRRDADRGSVPERPGNGA